MADLIKNIYNEQLIQKLAFDIEGVYPSFQSNDFINDILDEQWESLELKERINHITRQLKKYLPTQYEEAISIIDKVVLNYGNWLDNVAGFFPTFVEMYGLDDANWDTSIQALKRYTCYSSAEFAVRPFIMKSQTKMMQQMYEWSKDEDACVRRLASEGCRPALPWGPALKQLKIDPTPIFPILEQLKTDSDLYVRKSVANNLNDISKTHPELVIALVKEWYGKNEYTDWIVKHGCRTLLKKGNEEALHIFGFGDSDSVSVTDFALSTTSLSLGEKVAFSFSLSAKKATKVRLEYGVDYQKAKGKHNRKIFKISETTLDENQTKNYTKMHSFADVSTRKHYLGIHRITLIVNGKEQGTLSFELVK